MADSKYIVIDHESSNDLGNVSIAPEVLEVVLGIAASQVAGVDQMHGTLTNNLNSLLGRSTRGKGVVVSYSADQSQLVADVYVYLKYGSSVPKVALDLQKTLKQQLQLMTNMEMMAVNIHVVGLLASKENNIASAQ
ncbi:Asp23/Gls24 family envelope stress response protein [Lactobacillus sp. DCY120]|uniref:Asp23/Gls24 family envelope stress response protein n=1 Tax=Bombilactobacillus apium TaxID=2675299 RepID=A0A850R8A9_9LACO|nr:Asp23/Gls24 family envelope stress response protein [Bombilactobacillus apium]NVY96952.1 Asp23/Gls24 family envelope stress response protein [Bombilactobacillus apium]